MTTVETATESRRAAAPAAFNEASYPVEISAEDREIGLRTKRYFDEKLKRRAPWLIKNGRITVLKGTLAPSALETIPGAEPLATLKSHLIDSEALAKEKISSLLASVLFTFKRIEDKLADFSGHSYGLFRNMWGINNSYHQWSFEENQHSDAIALILERTGHLTTRQAEDDYYENLASTWEPPFDTARRMVLYAAFQEQLTSLNYDALAKRSIDEDAPVAAEIMRLISHDEAYHGGGYRAFSRIFADLDLEGSIRDALHVASNFRMPAQHLMRDLKRNSMEIVRVGAFSKELVSEQTVYRVLKGLGFVPEDLARQTASAYWR